MGEFIFEIAIGVLEAFFELIGEGVLDLVLRWIFRVFGNFEIENPILAYIGYGFLGLLAGGLSILVFPHPLAQPARIRGISLLIGPSMAGCVMSFVGSSLRKRNKVTLQIESFACGFSFAFGMALVRLLLVK